MKRKVWLLALSFAALVGVVVLAASFFFDDGEVRFKEKIRAAKPEGCIEGFAAPASFGYFITDLIEYQVTVVYCAGIEVDEEQLLKGINLSPFEIVENVKIRKRSFSDGLNELTLSYILQAIDVYPGEEYAFPDIPVEYHREGNVQGDVYWIDNAPPIYISKITLIEPILVDGRIIEFRPIKKEIAPKKPVLSQEILLAIGGALALLGIIEFLYRIMPKRAARRIAKISYGEEILAILDNLESYANHSARPALHKLYNLVLELSRGQNQESLERLGEEISLLAYDKDQPTGEDAIEKIEKLRQILFGERGGDY